MKINKQENLYTLYKEKEPIGWAAMEGCDIGRLEIAPQWRGKGYGSYLLKELLKASGGYEKAAPSFHTAPLPLDSGELAFWAKFDFVPTDGRLVRSRRPDFSAVQLAHAMVERLCAGAELAIDATCGNGHDTVFLCGLAKQVIAIDIQPQAVENTKARLAKAGFANAQVLVEDHANLARLAQPGTVDCVLFNFGWLPGADHQVFSGGEGTIAALKAALSLLKKGGVLSAILYSGKVIGDSEKQAALAFFKSLPLTEYTAILCDFANYASTAPLPCIIIKK